MNWRAYLVKPSLIPVTEHLQIMLTKSLNLKYLRFSGKQHTVLQILFSRISDAQKNAETKGSGLLFFFFFTSRLWEWKAYISLIGSLSNLQQNYMTQSLRLAESSTSRPVAKTSQVLSSITFLLLERLDVLTYFL